MTERRRVEVVWLDAGEAPPAPPASDLVAEARARRVAGAELAKSPSASQERAARGGLLPRRARAMGYTTRADWLGYCERSGLDRHGRPKR